MNKQTLLFVIIMFAIMTQYTANCGILRTICERICYVTCRVKCLPIGGYLCPLGCRYACKRLCGKRKREALTSSGDAIIVPMPCKFSVYDKDANGHVTVDELGSLIQKTGKEEDVKRLFAVIDTDKNGKITKTEVDAAPLLRDNNCLK